MGGRARPGCAQAVRARRRGGSRGLGAGVRARRSARPGRGAQARRSTVRRCSWGGRWRLPARTAIPAPRFAGSAPAALPHDRSRRHPARRLETVVPRPISYARWLRRQAQRRCATLIRYPLARPQTPPQPTDTLIPKEVSLFINRMPRYEILSEEAMEVLDRGWRRLLSEIGIE